MLVAWSNRKDANATANLSTPAKCVQLTAEGEAPSGSRGGAKYDRATGNFRCDLRTMAIGGQTLQSFRGVFGGEGGIRTPGATRAHVISSHAG